MTISTTTNRTEVAGNGVTTAFATGFVFFDDTDLVVLLVNDITGDSVAQTLTTDYTVSGGDGSTGTVTMLTAPPDDYTLIIYRDVPFTQESHYTTGSNFPASTLETDLDRLAVQSQQNNAALQRAARLAAGDVSGADPTLPSPAPLEYLRWNAAGTALESTAPVSVGDLDSADFLRSNVADQVDGQLTFATAPSLANNVPVNGKETGGTARQLAAIADDDTTHFGNQNLPTVIEHDGSFTEIGGDDVLYAPAAPTGYIRLTALYVQDEVVKMSGDSFDVAGGVTQATWESVGPTGSGADNIWTDLDDIPAGVKAVIINARLDVTGTTIAPTRTLRLRKTGSAEAGMGDDGQVEGETSTDNKLIVQYMTFTVPVDSSGRFDVRWDGNGASGSVVIYKVGFAL